MKNTSKTRLLQEIAAISSMERGKLSLYSFKDRPQKSGPYHKLQRWENGKNVTRYVSAEELPQVEAALSGYEQFQRLAKEYSELVIGETRAAIAGSKKNSSPGRSGSRRTRRSSS